MKKVKILVTTLMVCILCFGATFAVLGYDHIENFFCDVFMRTGKAHFTTEEITPTKSEACSMVLYYDTIYYDGEYEVGIYQERIEGVYYYYDSKRRSVKATNTSGFSSTRVYGELKEDYVVMAMARNTNIQVDKLKVSYN